MVMPIPSTGTVSTGDPTEDAIGDRVTNMVYLQKITVSIYRLNLMLPFLQPQVRLHTGAITVGYADSYCHES